MQPAKPLDGLIEFVKREPWVEDFIERLGLHFAAMSRVPDLEAEEYPEFLGDANFSTLWLWCLEDFASSGVGEIGNIVDDYLKRKGYKESALKKTYLKALSTSVASIYEVVEVEPRQGLVLKDLLRGGEPLRVRERDADAFSVGELLGARILPVRKELLMATGVLWLDGPTVEAAMGTVRRVGEGIVLDMYGEDEGAAPDMATWTLSDFVEKTDAMNHVALILANLWLRQVLEEIGAIDPDFDEDFDEEDGPRIVVRYPLKPGIDEAAVRAALSAIPNLEAEGDAAWYLPLPEGGAEQPEPANDLTLEDGEEAPADEERRFAGVFVLTKLSLIVLTDSDALADQCHGVLEPALSDLVEPPIRQDMTGAGDGDGMENGAPDDFSFEELTEFIAVSSKIFGRRMLDEPCDEFDGLSPRQAAAMPDRRGEAAEWVRGLERELVGRSGSKGVSTVDTTWLWEELGLTDLRE